MVLAQPLEKTTNEEDINFLQVDTLLMKVIFGLD